MKLHQYLKGQNMAPALFAKKLGVSSEAVRLWTKGERIPTPDLMASIYRLTEATVAPNDFYKLSPGKPTKHATEADKG